MGPNTQTGKLSLLHCNIDDTFYLVHLRHKEECERWLEEYKYWLNNFRSWPPDDEGPHRPKNIIKILNLNNLTFDSCYMFDRKLA